jgi:hypothetical protein
VNGPAEQILELVRAAVPGVPVVDGTWPYDPEGRDPLPPRHVAVTAPAGLAVSPDVGCTPGAVHIEFQVTCVSATPPGRDKWAAREARHMAALVRDRLVVSRLEPGGGLVTHVNSRGASRDELVVSQAVLYTVDQSEAFA